MKEFERFSRLFGDEALAKLKESRIAVFGIGGVGGWAVEALARCGVGHFDLFDGDVVDPTNINRQAVALLSTVGKNKAEVMKKRIEDISPYATVCAHPVFYTAENADEYPFDNYDYIIDAIDSVPDKIEIIKRAKEKNIPIISAMGAGKKTDPSAFEVSDIYKTSVCPLAKTMRKKLKEEGIESLKVVFSKELPKAEGAFVSSVIFAVSGSGMMIARECVLDITGFGR